MHDVSSLEFSDRTLIEQIIFCRLVSCSVLSMGAMALALMFPALTTELMCRLSQGLGKRLAKLVKANGSLNLG